MKEHYKKFQSINSQLKEITEHKDVMPKDGIFSTMDLFKLFQEQVTYIIETIHRLEDKHEIEKLEFDVNRILPNSLKNFCVLMKCHQIDLFLQSCDLSINKIRLKESNQNKCNKCENTNETEERIQESNRSTPIAQENTDEKVILRGAKLKKYFQDFQLKG